LENVSRACRAFLKKNTSSPLRGQEIVDLFVEQPAGRDLNRIDLRPTRSEAIMSSRRPRLLLDSLQLWP
jgi:hypothetical protein